MDNTNQQPTEQPSPKHRARLGSAALILDDSWRVLLVRHGHGRGNWDLPGGGVEAGESATDAVIREVREETGLTVTVERLCGVYYEPDRDAHHLVFACTIADGTSKEPYLADPDEITEIDWFALAELPRPIQDFTVRRIEEALLHAGEEADLLPVAVGPRRQLDE
jgi:ADP-ribose pyrophosphatase YjhB (NUDIX family)